MPRTTKDDAPLQRLIDTLSRTMDALPHDVDADLVERLNECARELAKHQHELELHSALLNGAVDAIAAHTLDGRLVYANPAALDHWGMTFEEAVAAGPFGWVAEDLRSAAHTRMERLEHGDELRFESRGLGPNGDIYVEVHSRVVETPDGPLVIADVRDISRRIETEEMVRYLAYHDTLTGLANRVLLESELHDALVSADRHGDVVGVIYLDLDNFKPVNDTYGHAVGDQVLREVANRVAGCVREGDTVARTGGDEFVVLLPRLASPDDLPPIARKLAQEVAEPILIGDALLQVNASTGLAVRQHAEDAVALLTRADLAMYEARQSGTPGWERFSVACG